MNFFEDEELARRGLDPGVKGALPPGPRCGAPDQA